MEERLSILYIDTNKSILDRFMNLPNLDHNKKVTESQYEYVPHLFYYNYYWYIEWTNVNGEIILTIEADSIEEVINKAYEEIKNK